MDGVAILKVVLLEGVRVFEHLARIDEALCKGKDAREREREPGMGIISKHLASDLCTCSCLHLPGDRQVCPSASR